METDKPQESQTKKDKSISNESDKGTALNKSSSLDNSRPSERTETEDTVKTLNKTRSISSASLSDKNNKKQQPKEIKFRNDNLRSDTPSVSSIPVHGESITTVSPDKERIPFKDKKEKISENLITGNDTTQEPYNPSKKEKVDSIIDEKNTILKKSLHHVKIIKNTLVLLMIRHVNLMILQLILKVVQEIWTRNVK